MASPRFVKGVLGTSLLLTAWVAMPGSAQQPASVEWSAELRSTVETVDQQRRELLLRDGTGDLTTVEVGPDVANLPQVRAGDQVVVRYRHALAARLARPGSPAPSDEDIDIDSAPIGSRPGARVSDVVRVRVRIEAVDTSNHTLRFIGPRGVPRRVVLRNPGMQAFARDLKPGDEVDVTYTEAVAISVEPAGR